MQKGDYKQIVPRYFSLTLLHLFPTLAQLKPGVGVKYKLVKVPERIQPMRPSGG